MNPSRKKKKMIHRSMSINVSITTFKFCSKVQELMSDRFRENYVIKN